MATVDNTEQSENWNGASGSRWIADAERRDRVLKPVADLLYDAIDIADGARVLDLGCGCGVTTLAAARGVGPNGAALGVDISDVMLAVARERAIASKLTNVEFESADVQSHEFGDQFDAVISRFGTMFYGDPVKAFTNVGSAMKPGAELRLVTWQSLDANAWMVSPGRVLADFGPIPESLRNSGPGPFGQSDPEVVATVLDQAGFIDIAVEPHDVELIVGSSPEEAVDFLSGMIVVRTILEDVVEPARSEALAVLANALRSRSGDGPVELDGAVLLISART